MFFPIGDDQVEGGLFPIFSYSFIALNILVFVYQMNIPPEGLDLLVKTYASVPQDIMQGKNLHTLLTSMFLHGGFSHLLGNMLFLWVFADNIEATIGSRRFVIFYLLGGLFAHAGHIFFNVSSIVPTVGASGAISAVMGAYLIMFPGSRVKLALIPLIFITFRIPAFLFLGFWIGQQFLAGTASLEVTTAQSAGVAWWAHIGGFLFGVIAGLYYRNTDNWEASTDPNFSTRDFS